MSKGLKEVVAGSCGLREQREAEESMPAESPRQECAQIVPPHGRGHMRLGWERKVGRRGHAWAFWAVTGPSAVILLRMGALRGFWVEEGMII